MGTDRLATYGAAFEMLCALGQRSFALLTIEGPMTFRLHWEEGLLHAIAQRGDPEGQLTVATSPCHDGARRRQAVRHLLLSDRRPTAVMAMFDSLALNEWEVAEARSLCAPRDLRVVGFDSIAPAVLARPGLTIFEQSGLPGGLLAGLGITDQAVLILGYKNPWVIFAAAVLAVV